MATETPSEIDSAYRAMYAKLKLTPMEIQYAEADRAKMEADQRIVSTVPLAGRVAGLEDAIETFGIWDPKDYQTEE